MLFEWLASHPWAPAFYALHSLACGLALWALMRRLLPPVRNFVIDPETGETSPHPESPDPYSLVRCTILSASLLALGFLSLSPLLLPVPFGFGGFQFLYMLAGIAIWTIGGRIAIGLALGTEKGWLAAMIVYAIIASLAYAALAPAWRYAGLA